jgi:zinc transport system substrate-binding protein
VLANLQQIKDNQSPHNFHLKPSQMSLVSQADLLISVHPSIEEGIAKALDLSVSNFLLNTDKFDR